MTPVEGLYPLDDLVQEMCDRLGLDPNQVARLDLEPTFVFRVTTARSG